MCLTGTNPSAITSLIIKTFRECYDYKESDSRRVCTCQTELSACLFRKFKNSFGF